MLIDAHCHVAVTPRTNSKQPRDPAEVVLDRARAAGVGGFVVVGSFDSELNVFDRDRNLVQSMPKGYLDFSVDGFVIRFAWPDK